MDNHTRALPVDGRPERLTPRASLGLRQVIRPMTAWTGWVAIAVFGPLALAAQLRGPDLGFVHDAEIARIRPILGIAGASRLGAPLDLGSPIRQAVFSEDRAYVLALATDGAMLVLPTATRTLSRISPPFDVDDIVLSPTGNHAALVDRDGSRLAIISGLPGRPTLDRTVEIPSVYGSPEVLAISDHGLLLTTFAGSGSVYLIGLNGLRPIAVFERVSAMAFLAGRTDVLIADDRADSLYLVREASGGAGRMLLADRTDGLAGPAAVSASRDGRRFFVADSESARVIVIDEAGQTRHATCGCTPRTLVPLRDDSVFGVSLPAADAPLWVFDGGADPPYTYVVPGVGPGTEP